MGEKRIAYRVWQKHVKDRDHLVNLAIGGRIILKWMVKIQDERVCAGIS
jgi:hypothetical protein